jgi:hypothetical protein
LLTLIQAGSTPAFQAALAEISRGRGKLYDPVVADACLEQFSSGKFKFD